MTSARANTATTPKLLPPARETLLLASIRHLGGLLDDLEQVRVANGNRIAAMEREFGDAFGLDAIQGHLRATEHQAALELVRLWRKHPLAPWARSIHGLGEKSIARLIASIGDPAERPNVAKLWAYCGRGDAARHRAKGMSQDELFRLGNPRAKKQVYLIATSFLKAGNRAVYDSRRAATAARLHESRCVRCGPSGHPAQPGSPWSDGHKHADALRIVGKAFLLDLWIASRHVANDAHTTNAGGDIS